MRVASARASLAFKFFIAAAGTVALAEQAGLFAGQASPYFLFYFTNISNIAVTVYFWCAAVAQARGVVRDGAPWRPRLKHALTLAITVTGLVAHFMLNGGGVFTGGTFHWSMLVVHYIVPICTVLDWLVFDAKGTMSFREPPTWIAFPLCYLVYINVLVLGVGLHASADAGTRWPYPFLDIDALGVPMVALTIVGLVVFFILLGCLYVVIDRAMAKRGPRDN